MVLANCTSLDVYKLQIPSNVYAILQLMRRPIANYMDTVQQDITKGMRAILIDWLVEVDIWLLLMFIHGC
jgi:hypothetical protein